ncbi:MAG: hypothetical protein KGL39_41710 [Patescibacteria group bacterium]|nr:hypothetical protein [Patescibacteria group bacterium]
MADIQETVIHWLLAAFTSLVAWIVRDVHHRVKKVEETKQSKEDAQAARTEIVEAIQKIQDDMKEDINRVLDKIDTLRDRLPAPRHGTRRSDQD